MGGSTLLLILKSLLPLAKEIILKDKDLHAFLLDNKLASILSGCLIFLFVLFLYVSEVADKNSKELERLKISSSYEVKVNEELKARIAGLELDKANLLKTLSERQSSPSPGAGNHGSSSKTKGRRNDENLKFYLEQRLKTLEQHNGK